MKKSFLIILITAISFALSAQTKFEKGYFVDNEGKKVECLIKNEIWRYNPTAFYYKINDQDLPVTANVTDVKEFGLYEGSRFISTEVMVDISPEDADELSKKEDPEWMKMHLFLSVMVEGKATLYQYHTPLMRRFFFSKEDQPLQQLVYKNYKLEGRTDIGTNLYFRHQLWNSVNYPGLTATRISATEYSESHLVKLFTDYNKNSGIPFTTYHRKKSKGEIHIGVNAGPAFSSLATDNTSDNVNLEEGINTYNYFFETQTTFRAGVSFELVFPNTNKKISMLVEPTYRSFHGQVVGELYDTVVADIILIDIPIGFRYYAFLNKDFRLFGNVNLLFLSMAPGSNIYFEGWDDSTLSTGLGLAVGGGANWKRFSAEFRYNLKRKMFSNHSLVSKYGNIEIILGCRIF